MRTLQECIHEYGKQIKKGYINMAYKGLMEFLMDLSHLSGKYPEFITSGSIYDLFLQRMTLPASEIHFHPAVF